MKLRSHLIPVAAPFLALLFLAGAAPALEARDDQKPEAKQPAQAESQEAEGVTFVNRSRDTQNVLAVFGGEKCEEMTERAQVSVEAGKSATVASGDADVCWCASTLGKVGNCTVWNKAKAGKKVTIR